MTKKQKRAAKKASANAKNITVELHKGFKGFAQNHLDICNELINPLVYPYRYGESLVPELKYLGRELIAWDDIEWDDLRSQKSRFIGKNPYVKEIRQDIIQFGWKLKLPPIVVVRMADGKCVVVDGRTRAELLGPEEGGLNLPFIIVDVYVPNSDNERLGLDLSDGMSRLGLILNTENSPAGELVKEDVYKECMLAIENRWIDWDETNWQAGLEAIAARVNEVCGNGVFNQKTKDELAYRIINHWSDKSEVFSWFTPSERVKFMWEKKYVDTEKIKYYVVSASTLSSSMLNVARVACEFPNHEIRVVIHTGTLKSFDVEGSFRDKVNKFRTFWNATLQDMSTAFFHNADAQKDRIVLWGVLPAYREMHPMEKIVRFVSPCDDHPSGMVPDLTDPGRFEQYTALPRQYAA